MNSLRGCVTFVLHAFYKLKLKLSTNDDAVRETILSSSMNKKGKLDHEFLKVDAAYNFPSLISLNLQRKFNLPPHLALIRYKIKSFLHFTIYLRYSFHFSNFLA